MQPQEEGIDTLSIVLVGIIGTLLTYILVNLAQVLYLRFEASSEWRSIQEIGNPEKRRVFAEQRHKVAEYRWVDKEAGLVAVPIDQAMNDVVDNLNANTLGRSSTP